MAEDDRRDAQTQASGGPAADRRPVLGEGVPANVDIHDTGGPDVPEDDWGEPAGEGAVYGANHTRRPERTEALRGQGVKTRQANKDIISKRV